MILACCILSPTKVHAWGDNGGGRKSYTLDEVNSGVLGDSIVFNSISDSVIGDEKNFVGARENTGINDGVNNVWCGNEITVEDGKEYLIRIYVHNNSPLGLDAVSENTRVAFNVPEESSKRIQINGYIYSDNATPSEYWDYVDFVSDHTFHLEYVYGSAIIENNGFASKINGGAKALSDEIVTAATSKHGVAIGYESLDGKVPGCYTYTSYIAIRVKVVYDYEFSIETGVRRSEMDNWHDKIKARDGDQMEFRIDYTNTDSEPQRQVIVQNVLPQGLTFLNGSIERDEASIPLSQNDLSGENLCIGDFDGGERASIRFFVRAEGAQTESGAAVNWVCLRVGSASKTSRMVVEFPSVLGTFTDIAQFMMVICLCISAGSFLCLCLYAYKYRKRRGEKGK